MILTKFFSKLSKGDASIAGGKGASLGEMTQAGIPVPPGFVVLSDSFEQFIKETDLVQEIDAILHKVDHKEIHTVEAASEKIRELILNAEMPKDIAGEITAQFKELNTKYVAVRSSATAEDGMDHAWAGQLESYLNTQEDDILTKVKLCWSSLFTPRAIFYRFEKGLHSTKISVAVVVQKMVESEFSGIAFSVHPVTEDHNQLIIEAGFGLGEAIVSGSVTPDSYVVEKEPRNILDINVSTQDRGLYRAENSSVEHGNNEWIDIPEPKASSQVLTKEQILELSEIIIGIENHYGFPCDIEWAFEKGKFYIVQSRPITTLTPKTENVKKKDELKQEKNLAEKFIEEIGAQELRPPIHSSSVLVHQSGWHTEKYMGRYYQNTIPYPLILITKNKEGVIYLTVDKEKELAREVFRLFWKKQLRIVKRTKEFEGYAEKVDSLFFNSLSCKKLQQYSEHNLIAILRQLKDALWHMNALAFFSIYFDKKICEEMIAELSIKISPEQLDSLWEKAVVSPGVSFEKRRQLFLFDLIQKDVSWPEIAEKCQYFETTYDYVHPLSKVEQKLYAEYGDYTKTEAQGAIDNEHNALSSRRQQNKKWLLSLAEEEQKIVQFTQFLIEHRDARKDYIMKAVTGFYRIAERLLADAGIPKEAAFYVSTDELEKGTKYLLDHRSLIEQRLTDGISILIHYNGEQEIEYGTVDENKKTIDNFYRTQHSIGSATHKSLIKGQIGAPGYTKGVVRVINNLQKERNKLNPGEILVTGMTRPEFVPLMKIAAGIITDEGGITCHAAIVSRELGIPCVIGTKVASQVLKDGDMVEVDADRGVITILNKNE